MSEISRAEQDAALDAETREQLGITGAEFARRWHAGHYRNDPDPRITQLAMLLPTWTSDA